jgi:hypothetical protein
MDAPCYETGVYNGGTQNAFRRKHSLALPPTKRTLSKIGRFRGPDLAGSTYRLLFRATSPGKLSYSIIGSACADSIIQELQRRGQGGIHQTQIRCFDGKCWTRTLHECNFTLLCWKVTLIGFVIRSLQKGMGKPPMITIIFLF